MSGRLRPPPSPLHPAPSHTQPMQARDHTSLVGDIRRAHTSAMARTPRCPGDRASPTAIVFITAVLIARASGGLRDSARQRRTLTSLFCCCPCRSADASEAVRKNTCRRHTHVRGEGIRVCAKRSRGRRLHTSSLSRPGTAPPHFVWASMVQLCKDGPDLLRMATGKTRMQSTLTRRHYLLYAPDTRCGLGIAG